MTTKWLSRRVLVSAVLAVSWWTSQAPFATADLAEGMVVYYPFDDAQGLVLKEMTGKGSDGELYNFPDDNSQWVAGKVGQALSYDGVDDHVIAPSYELATESLSVSAWVRANESGVWSSILKNWGGTLAGQFHFGLGPDAAGTLNVFITDGDGAAFNAGTDPEPLPIEEWQHVAFVADATDGLVRLYRNGEVVDERAYVGTFTPSPNSEALGIGVKTTNEGDMADPGACCPGYWNGQLDEIAMWSRALSSAELTEVYNLGVAGSPLLGGNTLAGDFDKNGKLEVADIDLLTASVQAGTNPAAFDLNNDQAVNQTDRIVWVEQLRKTYFGDSDLSGEFNSADFLQVFQAGEYEDATAKNSTWAEGDWSGDGEFDSADLVFVFQMGGYEAGPRPSVAAVPEPSSGLILALFAPMMMRRRINRRRSERHRWIGVFENGRPDRR